MFPCECVCVCLCVFGGGNMAIGFSLQQFFFQFAWCFLCFFQIFERWIFVKTTGIFPLILLPQTKFRAILHPTLSFFLSFLSFSLSFPVSLSLSLSLSLSSVPFFLLSLSLAIYLLFPFFCFSLFLSLSLSLSLSLFPFFTSLFFSSQILSSRKPVEQIVTLIKGRPKQNTPRASNRLNLKNQTAFSVLHRITTSWVLF